MFQPSEDPLGIGLQARAAQRMKDQQVGQDPSGWMNRPIQTVLPDPQWQGWFQALQEAGATNLGDSSQMERKGLWDPSNQPYEPTFDPTHQTSAEATAAPLVKGGYGLQMRPDANMAAGPGQNKMAAALEALKRGVTFSPSEQGS